MERQREKETVGRQNQPRGEFRGRGEALVTPGGRQLDKGVCSLPNPAFGFFYLDVSTMQSMETWYIRTPAPTQALALRPFLFTAVFCSVLRAYRPFLMSKPAALASSFSHDADKFNCMGWFFVRWRGEVALYGTPRRPWLCARGVSAISLQRPGKKKDQSPKKGWAIVQQHTFVWCLTRLVSYDIYCGMASSEKAPPYLWLNMAAAAHRKL